MVVLAQLAEHRIVVPSVVGSSPTFHPQTSFGMSFFCIVACTLRHSLSVSPSVSVSKLPIRLFARFSRCDLRFALCEPHIPPRSVLPTEREKRPPPKRAMRQKIREFKNSLVFVTGLLIKNCVKTVSRH